MFWQSLAIDKATKIRAAVIRAALQNLARGPGVFSIGCWWDPAARQVTCTWRTGDNQGATWRPGTWVILVTIEPLPALPLHHG